ncbi:MAG: hypothetical protein E2P03_03475 [Acidobacteria bacterium]|nr:MAG: hypothetical protein E2P03_03475 [Acidobacteriota bacterium]
MMTTTSTLSLAQVRDALLILPQPFQRGAVQDVVERLQTAPGELDPYLNFSSSGYTRTQFYHGPLYEILVLCWRAGQASPIHDHAASICSMAVIQGTCSSEVFHLNGDGHGQGLQAGEQAKLEPAGSASCGAGQILTVEGRDIHRISNRDDGGEDLVTVHVYLPPILTIRCFDEETGLCRVTEPRTLMPRL